MILCDVGYPGNHSFMCTHYSHHMVFDDFEIHGTKYSLSKAQGDKTSSLKVLIFNLDRKREKNENSSHCAVITYVESVPV
mmetsp:Transcript_10308/g.15005  ORF Transcript_10308/g.15005 Transcript_10308/m.15005 type:complete len:80 (-) Transcript_10308:340-579(-)